MVYKKDTYVNWDPAEQTVLANEQVIDGKGWRSGATVQRKKLPQWFFRITKYADDLIDSLGQLENWSEQVKTMKKAKSKINSCLVKANFQTYVESFNIKVNYH